jgi:hypothetical protein
MAKPILVVKAYKEIDAEQLGYMRHSINKTALSSEYHVLVIPGNEDKITFECYNDCKGLPDIDIEKLIKDLK